MTWTNRPRLFMSQYGSVELLLQPFKLQYFYKLDFTFTNCSIMTKDCVKKFFEYYVKGDLISAVGQILPLPDICYDQLESSDRILRWLINFVDASVFTNTFEARFQNTILRSLMDKEMENGKIALDLLSQEDQYLIRQWGEVQGQEKEIKEIPSYLKELLKYENEPRTLENSKIAFFLNQVPMGVRQLIHFQLQMKKGWQKLKKEKPLLIANFTEKYENLHPWYPLQYELRSPSLKMQERDSVPVIFFEPVKEELSIFLHQLDRKPALYVFRTLSHLFQMLQFSNFVDSLVQVEHVIYILEFYPHSQFLSQDLTCIQSKNFEAVFFFPFQVYQKVSLVLMQALKACINQSRKSMEIDTVEGNWVYEISKRMLLVLQQNRLGISRLPALHVQQEQIRWYDKHKGVFPDSLPLGQDLNDPLKALLLDLSTNRQPFPRVKKNKLLLAHVVPQIISGGHAPSRLLESLVLNHNREKFDVIVISTEILNQFPLEYPYNFYTSPSSEERGKALLIKFLQQGVKVKISNNNFYYLSNAVEASQFLNEAGVDVVIFHGPDIINTMATQMVKTPLRILFEHGSQSIYPGYDLAIVSTFSALELYEEHYKKIHTKVIALPFAVDARERWQPDPFQKEAIGLPSKGLIMTTISTKLDVRLTDEMCHTIAEILRRVPDSYYAPIGDLTQKERIKTIFAEYGVADRFIPLSSKESPSQYARCMDLYLNEFPFGGCLALLDAMAAGCPVVTMYDAHGPQQARYGGHFMGLDRVITTGDKQEYIELACKLLTNQPFYQEWVQHTLSQYEKFANVKTYVKTIEELILNNLN